MASSAGHSRELGDGAADDVRQFAWPACSPDLSMRSGVGQPESGREMRNTLTHVIPALDWGNESFHLSEFAFALQQQGIASRIVTMNPHLVVHRTLEATGATVCVRRVRGRLDYPGLWRLAQELSDCSLVQSWGAATRVLGWLRRVGLCPMHWIATHLGRSDLPAEFVDPLVVDLHLTACGVRPRIESGVDARRPIRASYPLPRTEAGRRVQTLRERLGIPAECHLVGTAGALAPADGIPDVIWAADLLKVVRDDVHVVILGDGPERWRWERFNESVQSTDRVHFGALDVDACGAIAELDCYWEVGHGRQLGWGALCAISHEIPIIASRSGERGCLHASTEDGHAHLIDVGDRAQLAQRTIQILDHPEQAAALAKRVKRRFVDGAAGQIAPSRAVANLVSQLTNKN